MEKKGVRCKGFRFCHTKVQDTRLVPIVTLRLIYHCGKFHKNSLKCFDFIKIFSFFFFFFFKGANPLFFKQLQLNVNLTFAGSINTNRKVSMRVTKRSIQFFLTFKIRFKIAKNRTGEGGEETTKELDFRACLVAFVLKVKT